MIVVDNFDRFYPRAAKESNLAWAAQSPLFRLIELDIRDAEGVKRLVDQSRPDVLVHLAVRAGVRPSIENPGLYADVNVLGTVHWLEAAAWLEPRPRFVYASSSSVYGDRTNAPFRETDPVDLPVSPCAATKESLLSRRLGPGKFLRMRRLDPLSEFSAGGSAWPSIGNFAQCQRATSTTRYWSQ